MAVFGRFSVRVVPNNESWVRLSGEGVFSPDRTFSKTQRSQSKEMITFLHEIRKLFGGHFAAM